MSYVDYDYVSEPELVPLNWSLCYGTISHWTHSVFRLVVCS